MQAAMLGDYDSIQEWNVAKLFCSFNRFHYKPKQHMFSTNTRSRTVLFFDEKLNRINSFTSSCFILILMMRKVKKKKSKAAWEALKEKKKFSSSSKAMKANLTKKRKTHNNTQNWKMSSVVSLFSKKKITKIISWNLK